MSFYHPIEWTDEKIAKLWDYYSRTPPFADSYFSKAFGKEILLRSRIPLRKPLNVVDFGCGPGFMWDHLVSLGASWSYTGLDFSSDSIRILQEKGRGRQQFKSAVHISSLPSPLASNSIDAILLLEVVEHLSEKHLQDTLHEVHRILVPGGTVLISTPNEENLALATKMCPDCGALFHEWQHVRSWSKGTLAELMESKGFQTSFAETLEFSSQGALRKMATRLYRVLTGSRKNPHLLAGFQKPNK